MVFDTKFYYALVWFLLNTRISEVDSKRTDICGETKHLLLQRGSIHSPYYPNPYPPRTECTWTILPPPNSRLTIIVTDIEIEEDKNCTDRPCCTLNHLALPSNGSESYNFCGDFTPSGPISLTKNQTIIKFKSSDLATQSRGFNLSYIIMKMPCNLQDFICDDGTCLPKSAWCDGVRQCADETDEIRCQECLGVRCQAGCISPNKLCNNGVCVLPSLWCDGNDDCGDNSDEENCIRNSVISATIMGCLFCGLMLVIAVMCALRLYTIRSEASYRLSLPPHIAARLSMTNSISLPALIDDEFFHREPPPAYSVAVGQADASMTGVEIEPNIRRSRIRCHRARPLLKPPTPSPSTDTSNQSSPSRGSITSSSYLSNDDSANFGT